MRFLSNHFLVLKDDMPKHTVAKYDDILIEIEIGIEIENLDDDSDPDFDLE
jgi:hypothetical protein